MRSWTSLAGLPTLHILHWWHPCCITCTFLQASHLPRAGWQKSTWCRQRYQNRLQAWKGETNPMERFGIHPTPHGRSASNPLVLTCDLRSSFPLVATKRWLKQKRRREKSEAGLCWDSAMCSMCCWCVLIIMVLLLTQCASILYSASSQNRKEESSFSRLWRLQAALVYGEYVRCHTTPASLVRGWKC